MHEEEVGDDWVRAQVSGQGHHAKSQKLHALVLAVVGAQKRPRVRARASKANAGSQLHADGGRALQSLRQDA